MAPVTPIRLTVDRVLSDFFHAQRGRVSGLRRRRVEAAESALRRCFEEEADAVLTDPELHLLAVERQFGVDGAAARVAEPDALLQLLPDFLDDAEWHGGDREDRRLRLHLALALTGHVVRLPELSELSFECAVQSIEAAVARAAADLRTTRIMQATAAGR